MKITAKEQTALLDLLVRHLGSSKTKIKQLAGHGLIAVDGRAVKRTDIIVRPGQMVEIVKKPILKERPPFAVLYEDEHLVVAEKPAGVLAIATEKEKTETFYRAVSGYVKRAAGEEARIFIVHRLDREASGLMVFAKSKDVKDSLQKNWDRTEKLYYALVEGRPPEKEGKVEGWLCESGVHKVEACPKGRPGAQYSVTHYRVLKTLPGYSLLEIRLETGRKHQIRVHMAGLGCPMAGDRRYGAKASPMRRMGLHAFGLAFVHPVSGKRVVVESPMPRGFGRGGENR
jgi:23S rRNA pseudouridine1911/1915/1917 synthase